LDLYRVLSPWILWSFCIGPWLLMQLSIGLSHMSQEVASHAQVAPQRPSIYCYSKIFLLLGSSNRYVQHKPRIIQLQCTMHASPKGETFFEYGLMNIQKIFRAVEGCDEFIYVCFRCRGVDVGNYCALTT
jgi:hypothetical protein